MTLFDVPSGPDESRGPSGPTVRVRLVVAYDGSPFHGFAVNAGVRTVGGTLTEALATVLRHPVDVTCAGRTDKGVHARGQVVTFEAEADRVHLPSMQKALNKLCGPAIAVTEAAVVALEDQASGLCVKAFIGWNGKDAPSVIDLKRFCSEQLPAYMIPDRFSVQSELPKTSTDKIDYQRLKEMA